MGLIGVQETEFRRAAENLVDIGGRTSAGVASTDDEIVGSGIQMVDTECAGRHVSGGSAGY